MSRNAPKKQSAPTSIGQPVRTSYASNDVPIPADFLSGPPPDPVTLTRIDWSGTPLPENGDRYAVVLDNVLTPAECAQLIALAEASATTADAPWQPAMVNIGGGFEILEPAYRSSDRIIWDQQAVVDRLWARCALAPGLREDLATFHRLAPARGGKVGWKFDRFNKRMRFLKYGPGQFFRPHCDGEYSETSEDGTVFRTHYTVHLYLNDSAQAVGEGKADLVGGATSFLSGDEERRVDCDPKMGRVLIFQHSRLYHSGDDVVSGIKYTMRTDIMYEMVREKDQAKGV
ncbi:hypothetical protein CkaCkLH20_01848 [Colletotrichum karsti]|uniref:Prolyl 4-hydroxylase alpha subunit domain-containing protein n=1 Tax=Colletotrichum karsti TaxID=1095194 RepID=A0A9P6IHD4_9PEZI|nr:uncharacterized protein CkaCkLH20_01848 [Colletotrichum karsti]KAF9880806.1 hypothetical protein CkaCkLH20_01848 [Colletotrichum karsti]